MHQRQNMAKKARWPLHADNRDVANLIRRDNVRLTTIVKKQAGFPWTIASNTTVHFISFRKIAEGGMATMKRSSLGPRGFPNVLRSRSSTRISRSAASFCNCSSTKPSSRPISCTGTSCRSISWAPVGGVLHRHGYIQGPTLRSVIDRHNELGRPIPATLVAYVGSRLCRALDFAHNFVGPDGRPLDIVHRDVSPGNVMITWDGHIKLGDFGIAKARTSIDPASEQNLRMGKKRYMSPEQVVGTVVDARSDVFSLGVVLLRIARTQSTSFTKTTRRSPWRKWSCARSPTSVRGSPILTPSSRRHPAPRLAAAPRRSRIRRHAEAYCLTAGFPTQNGRERRLTRSSAERISRTALPRFVSATESQRWRHPPGAHGAFGGQEVRLASRTPFPSVDSAVMKVYTKTGDRGDTALFGGGRVPKSDPRVEAYGEVDELNAFIGVARSVESMPRIDEVLVPIQRDLFAIGALLATPDRGEDEAAPRRRREWTMPVSSNSSRPSTTGMRNSNPQSIHHSGWHAQGSRAPCEKKHRMPARRTTRRGASSGASSCQSS